MRAACDSLDAAGKVGWGVGRRLAPTWSSACGAACATSAGGAPQPAVHRAHWCPPLRPRCPATRHLSGPSARRPAAWATWPSSLRRSTRCCTTWSRRACAPSSTSAATAAAARGREWQPGRGWLRTGWTAVADGCVRLQRRPVHASLRCQCASLTVPLRSGLACFYHAGPRLLARWRLPPARWPPAAPQPAPPAAALLPPLPPTTCARTARRLCWRRPPSCRRAAWPCVGWVRGSGVCRARHRRLGAPRQPPPQAPRPHPAT